MDDHKSLIAALKGLICPYTVLESAKCGEGDAHLGVRGPTPNHDYYFKPYVSRI